MVPGSRRPGPPASPWENTDGLGNGFQTLAASLSPGPLLPAALGPTWPLEEMVGLGPESLVLFSPLFLSSSCVTLNKFHYLSVLLFLCPSSK